jgi:carbamoyltransferase
VLADPRRRDARERLNQVVKKREAFRPFGASILAEALADWLEVPPGDGAAGPRGLMLLAYPVRPERRAEVPAVVHEDGTCRIQTVAAGPSAGGYRRLLEGFRDLTSVPLLLNTSFNDREPIVCTAEDAARTAVASGMDLLVMPPFVAQLAGRRSSA